MQANTPAYLLAATSGLSKLDWTVLIVYGTAMLGIGIYYSRGNQTTEDYHLGGRRMKSWTIGLSLFATLLSTISYLAYPGEMIQNGPMIFSGLLAYPPVIFVVGWLLVPYFCRLRVTSAYEILELRLGLGARMLASVFFLLLRLVWMAMIIYATTEAVLVPVMRIDPKYAPWVSAAIGLLTVVYTTLGGLRAVVITDVIQTFILFLGAIVAVALISHSLGGVGQWIPHEWDPAWEKPKIGFDSTARVTLANATLMNFLWYVCTYGSDQLAIQRYLSTRDVKAARRAMLYSLVADVLVTALLATLGFALLAYFRANPQQMPAGAATTSHADRLFSYFIMIGLPGGMSGLVVAGLLAAGMSSLSAGVNSVCSVIATDFVERFGLTRAQTEAQRVRLLRILSFGIGIFIVLLSLMFQFVRGNLMETAKYVNLFVAPLFVLFFFALWVPWGRQLGAVVGAVSGLAMGAAIAFYEVFGLKFLWIMPCSLAVGIVVGCVVSLLPIGSTAAQRKPTLHEPTPPEQGGYRS